MASLPYPRNLLRTCGCVGWVSVVSKTPLFLNYIQFGIKRYIKTFCST